MRLVDGDRVLELSRASGFRGTRIERTPGAVRVVEHDQPDRDGAYDETARHGAGSLTLEVTLAPENGRTRGQLLDDVRSFLRPNLRPWFVYQEVEGQPERRVGLRAGRLSGAWEIPGSQKIVVQWSVPDGVAEGTVLHQTEINPEEPVEGRTYDLMFDRAYPESKGTGRLLVKNAGTTAADPVIRIFGPCDGPRIANETTGERLEFDPTFTIAQGSYLELDFKRRTAQMESMPGLANSRTGRLDHAVSHWWRLEPGDNEVRYYPAAATSPPSTALVMWRDAYL